MPSLNAKHVSGIAAVAFLSVAVNIFALQDAARNRAPKSADLAAAIDQQASTAQEDFNRSGGEGVVGTAAAPRVIAKVAPPVLSNSELIRSIQRELNERNYAAGRPDGVVGIMTRAAIMAYQQDYGLPLTAEPSEELLSRIVLGASASPAASSSRDAQPASGEAMQVVRQVKKQLSALGYATGVSDGVMTAEIAASIRTFEARNNLPVTGRISAPLVQALAVRYRAVASSQPATR